MRGRLQRAALALGAILAVSAVGFAGYRAIDAADHLDPPARTDPAVDPTPDRAADIADIYVFHDANNLVLALTFGGPQATTLPAIYDRDVSYIINISNAGARTDAEIPIEIRFGLDGPNPGVQVTGLPPGGSGAIRGPVERDLTNASGIIVRAGLFDDPFFFDSQGLRESRTQGVLRFNNRRSFFDSQNITGVIIQIPRPLVENGTNKLDIWTTSARIGGQL